MGIKTGCVAVLSVFASAAALPVFAAEKAASSTELEVITVTAQKRAESEQTVPLSMTTFGAVALEQKAVVNFFDYGTKVPNLGFAATGDGMGTSRTISIRGVSGDNVTGFYVDETPLPDSIDPRVLDIDHIEVLRGPQGTLYGARSMGGTVRIITKQANFTDYSLTVHSGVSTTERTNRGNFTGDAVANIPLIADRLALRVSGFYDSQAGYFKRRYCADPATAGISCFPQDTDPSLVTTENNVGALKTYGGALSLSIKVNDNLTITPRMMQQKSTYSGFWMSDVLTTNDNIGYPYPAGPSDLPTLKPTNFTQGRFFNIPEGGYDDWHLYSVGLKWSTSVGELVSSSAYFDRKVFETEDQTDFIWSALLPAVTANPAFPDLPAPIRASISELKSYQRFVQEVRFASALQGKTQFVVGAFYSDFHGRLPFAAYYPPALAPGYGALLNAADTCNIVGLCPNPDNPDEIFGSDYRTSIKEPSLFGEVSYQITDALKVTGGLRWSQVKTTGQGYLEGTVAQSPGAPGRIIDSGAESKENSTTPKLQFDYRLNPTDMVYLTAAKGFRPGGLVPTVPAALCANQLPTGVTVDQTRSFKSDSLWNYELGTKTGWFDNRLTVNAAAFYIRWKDIQQNILLGCGFQYRANAGAATSKGGELEVRARPIDSLELSMGFGYQKAEITEAGTLSPQQSGDPVFQVPDWTANASGTWTAPISSDWKMISTLSYAFVGRSFSANNLSPNGDGTFSTRRRPGYELVDGRIALAHGDFELALVGKNLGNEAANLGDNRSLAAETPGRPRLIVNQPRTLGIEFRTSF